MRTDESALDDLIEATRRLEHAPHDECERLRGSVAARLGATGLGVGTAATAGKAFASMASSNSAASLVGQSSAVTVKASTASLVSALGVKVLGGVAVVAVAASLGVPLARSVGAPDGRAMAQKASPFAHMTRLRDQGSASASATIARASRTIAGALDTPPNDASQSHVTRGATVADPLAQELELVRAAQSELAARHPARVLALLDRYSRLFPRGILRPEARAARVNALCMAGRTAEAEREVVRLDRSNPDSPLAGRGRACKAP
jgi:hypothetical protein